MKTLGKNSLSSVIKFIIYAAWYIQLFFLVLLTGLLVAGFFRNKVIESDLDVRLTKSKPSAVTIAQPQSGIRTASLKLDSGKFHITHTRTWQTISYKLGVIWIGFAISLTITFLLLRLFNSLTQNNPFVVENARHLRKIAILIILISPLSFARDAFENWYLQQNFLLQDSGIRAHLVIDVKTVFAGFILLIIAEIFRIGAQMKEEQDLTV